MSAFDERDRPSWGPRHRTSLIGHDAAEQALLETWESGRLPHAWLIAGPKGIGKATLAFRFARFMLSRGMDGGDLFGAPSSLATDGKAPLFARIASAGHADLLTVERSWDDNRDRWRSEIVINDVRRLIPFFGLTAGEGGYRIAIVDAADEMNRNAANALLKVLEEPPPQSLLLLVAHAPGSLLSTIRSRCRLLTLRPLPVAQVSTILQDFLPDIAGDELASLARLADGSPGRALALAAEGGLDLYRDMFRLLDSLPQLDIPKVHALGERVARAAAAPSFRVLCDLIGWWLARMVRSTAVGQSATEVVPGEAALMCRLAGTRGLDHWVEVWENLTRLFARADSLALDRKQVVLNVFSALERAARP